MSPLAYTQRSVAFPRLPHREHETDEVSLSLEADGGGTLGEMKWTFMAFDRRHHGVQMSVFGDGLRCFFDERVQSAIADWRTLPADPDEVTPEGLIGILMKNCAEPSRYHEDGGA